LDDDYETSRLYFNFVTFLRAFILQINSSSFDIETPSLLEVLGISLDEDNVETKEEEFIDDFETSEIIGILDWIG